MWVSSGHLNEDWGHLFSCCRWCFPFDIMKKSRSIKIIPHKIIFVIRSDLSSGQVIQDTVKEGSCHTIYVYLSSVCV